MQIISLLSLFHIEVFIHFLLQHNGFDFLVSFFSTGVFFTKTTIIWYGDKPSILRSNRYTLCTIRIRITVRINTNIRTRNINFSIHKGDISGCECCYLNKMAFTFDISELVKYWNTKSCVHQCTSGLNRMIIAVKWSEILESSWKYYDPDNDVAEPFLARMIQSQWIQSVLPIYHASWASGYI
jgi:hypothetical protein